MSGNSRQCRKGIRLAHPPAVVCMTAECQKAASRWKLIGWILSWFCRVPPFLQVLHNGHSVTPGGEEVWCGLWVGGLHVSERGGRRLEWCYFWTRHLHSLYRLLLCVGAHSVKTGLIKLNIFSPHNRQQYNIVTVYWGKKYSTRASGLRKLQYVSVFWILSAGPSHAGPEQQGSLPHISTTPCKPEQSIADWR